VFAIQLVHAVEDCESRAYCTLGVVTVRHGRAEDGHDGVARELLERAAVLLDQLSGPTVVQRQGIANVLGIRAVGARREADEVDEEDGNELSLLAGCASVLEARAAAVTKPSPRRISAPAAGTANLRRNVGFRG